MKRHVFFEESEVMMELAESDSIRRKYEILKRAVLDNEGFVATDGVPHTIASLNEELFLAHYINKSICANEGTR